MKKLFRVLKWKTGKELQIYNFLTIFYEHQAGLGVTVECFTELSLLYFSCNVFCYKIGFELWTWK